MNFNTTPYFDDFDESKKFHKFLFRHNYPIQARELNGIQGVFQSQIKKFGNHFFKTGSRVSGGQSSYLDYEWIIVKGFDDPNVIDGSLLKRGMFIRSNISELHAQIMWVEPPVPDDDRWVVYLLYYNNAVDNVTQTFLGGETLSVSLEKNGAELQKLLVPCPDCGDPEALENGKIKGVGTLYTVTEGIFFKSGMFLNCNEQTILLSKYERIQSVMQKIDIGLMGVESIVTAAEDPDLYDQSLGYPNVSAPGADRYKYDLKLVSIKRPDDPSLPADANLPENFITLTSFIDGYATFMKADSEYSDIMQVIENRTYEESGHYWVTKPSINFIHNKKAFEGDAMGHSINGSDDDFTAIISPFVSYTRGHRNAPFLSTYIHGPKARETLTKRSQNQQIDDLQWIEITRVAGTSVYPNGDLFDAFNGKVIQLHTGALTDGPSGSKIPASAQKGSAICYDFQHIEGDRYKMFVANITINPATPAVSFADISAIYNPESRFIATVTSKRINQGELVSQVYALNVPHIKSLRDIDNPDRGGVTYTSRKKMVGSLDSKGSITFSAPAGEIFMDGPSTEIFLVDATKLSTLDKNTITVLPTSVTIKAGSTHAGKKLGIIVDSFIAGAKERTKVLKREMYEFGTINLLEKMYLPKADVIKIISISAFNKSNRAQVIPLGLEQFALDNGVLDYAYTNGTLEKTIMPMPPELTGDIAQYGLFVEFEYYEHSSSSGFLSVDSYSDAIANGQLKFEDIPVYRSKSGVDYRLSNSLDFRPLIIDGETKAASIPAVGSSIIYDCTYYVPRRDIIEIDNQGMLHLIRGVSGDRPLYPKPTSKDRMHLFNVDVGAYVYKIEDIKYKLIPNRRYTMRDIGALEKRLTNVEYYGSLSLLEAQAAKTKILDANGLERFKNGFVVDNFTDLQAADTTNPEFKAAIDVRRSELAPEFEMFNRRGIFNPALSTNFVVKNGQITPVYSEVNFDGQMNATKTISVNPYFVTPTKGQMILEPNMDTWSDTIRVPKAAAAADLGTELLKDVGGNFRKRLGAWTVTNATIVANGSTTNTAAASSIAANGVTTTTTRAVAQDLLIEQIARDTQTPQIGARVDSYDLGDHMTNVSFQPYMNAVTFKFKASKLAQGTRMYAFFDGIDVTDLCRMDMAGSLESDPLIVDGAGIIEGICTLPAGKFWVGNREFKLTNSPVNTTDADLLICTATAVFHAGGVAKDTQKSELNVTLPIQTIEDGRDTSVRQSPTGPSRTGSQVTVKSADGTVSTQFIVDPPPPPPRSRDPLGQSFTPMYDMYVTGIDLFFADAGKDPSELWVELRELVNGYPAPDPLVRNFFASTDIPVSTDSSVPYHVVFNYPVFLKGRTRYCWVVGGDSPQPRYFAARIGQESLVNPGTIVEPNQADIEVSFRSSNGGTWSAEQFEDLKYRLYRAEFDTVNASWHFDLENQYETREGGILKFTAGSNIVKLFLKDSASKSGDKVDLGLFERYTVTLRETDTNGSAIEPDETYVVGPNSFKFGTLNKNGDNYTCTVTEVRGTLATGDLVTINGRSFEVLTGLPASIFGIPAGELNKIHTLGTVKNQRFVELLTTTPATENGFYETEFQVSYNRQYNIVNVSAEILDRGTPPTIIVTGTTSNPFLYSDMPADDTLTETSVVLNSDVYLRHPNKIVSPDNTGKPTSVKFHFAGLNGVTSPIMSLNSVSSTMVGFILGNETPATFGDEYKDETDPSGGSQAYKYLTRPVILEKPAYEINIFLEVYNGPSNDYDIYFRSTPAHEIALINTKPWAIIPHTKVTSSNPAEKIEIELSLRDLLPDWADLEEIASFQVKIVGKGLNSANPPLFSNLRVIAST